MKVIIFLAFFSISTVVQAKEISGVVSITGNAPSGILYIFAKKYNGSMPMPLAVKKIPNPKFPVTFKLSAKDAMMEGVPFRGPFKVTARLSPSGDPMDKSGLESSTTEAIKLDTKNIKLVLKSK